MVLPRHVNAVDRDKKRYFRFSAADNKILHNDATEKSRCIYTISEAHFLAPSQFRSLLVMLAGHSKICDTHQNGPNHLFLKPSNSRDSRSFSNTFEDIENHTLKQ
jgi:hypothetical protein